MNLKSKKAKCSVIKDGGDDPDVTHGAEIIVELSFTEKINEINIDAGEGVGIVTKPGLGLEINKPAINPIPKKMIIENLREIWRKNPYRKRNQSCNFGSKGKRIRAKNR